MSKARSPRGVCSTTIGTRAMRGSVIVRFELLTSLLYVALLIAGSFFFASSGEAARTRSHLGRGCCFEGLLRKFIFPRAHPHRSSHHPCLDLLSPGFDFRRKLLQDQALCGALPAP